MQLDEWTALSPAVRQERRERWRNRDPLGNQQPIEEIEWLAMVHESADRLIRQCSDLSDVLYVGASCSFSDDHPISITVRTRLSLGQIIPEIPTEFTTFPVQQEAAGNNIQAHKETWSAVLSKLFGWSQTAIDDFIAGQEWVWRSAFFLHDKPCEWLNRQVLAKSFLPPGHSYSEYELFKIGDEMVRAIGGRFYVHEEPDYDWDAARKHISRVLEEYRRG